MRERAQCWNWNLSSCASREALREVRRLAFFLKLQFLAERIAQASFDEIDSQVRDVYADPLATEFLRRVNRRAATAEWVKHDA